MEFQINFHEKQCQEEKKTQRGVCEIRVSIHSFVVLSRLLVSQFTIRSRLVNWQALRLSIVLESQLSLQNRTEYRFTGKKMQEGANSMHRGCELNAGNIVCRL